MEATPLQSRPAPLEGASEPGPASGVVAGVLLANFALLFVLYYFGAPLYVLAIPAVIVGTMASLARPATGFIAILALSGFIGTLIAFTGLPIGALSGIGLVCLWLAAIGSHLTGRSERKVWLWPALLLPALYLAVTVVQMLASNELEYAFADFRITAWYMMAVLLLALGPWSSAVYRRVALGVVGVAVLVGLYALYRYIAGPSPEEFLQARGAVQRVSINVPVRFFGSFLSAFQLTAWCATAIPFMLALAFVSERRWRLAAAIAIPLCAFAVFASDVRTGLVAATLGVASVLVLFMLSGAFRVERLAIGALALMGIGAIGIGGYAIVISDSEESSERFSRILDPSEDLAYQERLTRWEEALDVIDREPFGYGLGTQGFVGQTKNPEGQTGPFNLDSAYLKVAIQQGYVMMALFVVSLVSILAGLARGALTTGDPWRCALAIGGAGAMVAQMFLFFAGIYSEGLTALSAWILIGLGCAGLCSASDDRPREPNVHSRPA